MSSQPSEPMPFDEKPAGRARRPLHVVPAGPARQATPLVDDSAAPPAVAADDQAPTPVPAVVSKLGQKKTPVVAPKNAKKLRPIAPPTPGGGLPATDHTGKAPQTAAVAVLPPPRNLAYVAPEPADGKAIPAPIVGPAPISEPIPVADMAAPGPAKFASPAPDPEALTAAPQTADLPHTEISEPVADQAPPRASVAAVAAVGSDPAAHSASSRATDTVAAATSTGTEGDSAGSEAAPRDTDAPAGIAAIIGHSTALVTGFLTWGLLPCAGPLALWFVYRNSHPRLRDAAARTFNFTLLVTFAGWALLFLALFGAASTGQTWLFWFLALPTVSALWGAGFGLPIWGIVQERRGQAYRYPANPGWIS